MALAQLDEIVAAFLRGGLAPDTPAAILSHATSESERIVDTRLGDLVADAKAHAIEAPAVIVVGAIAGLRTVLASGMVKP
jgi:uroporphyrin-III C-methyltransferase